MFTVEALQTDNRVVSALLGTLAEQGLVNVVTEEETGETTVHNKLLRYLTDCLEIFLSGQKNAFMAANFNLYYDPENQLRWYTPDVLPEES